MEDLIQTHVSTQYQKEQIEYQKKQIDIQTDIQQQMRDLLHKQVSEKTRRTVVKQSAENPEDEETVSIKKPYVLEDTYQPEQVDIQQQMKELLKKQQTAKAIQSDEDVDDEIEEDETLDENGKKEDI